MKIHAKILIATLPFLFGAIFAVTALNYYHSRKTLSRLAQTLLISKVDEAIAVVERYETMLQTYDLSRIEASVNQAKQTAMATLRNIRIGDRGGCMVIDNSGRLIFGQNVDSPSHDIRHSAWFKDMRSHLQGIISIELDGQTYLAAYRFFEPWGWYVLGANTHTDIYGDVRRMGIFILFLGGGFLLFAGVVLTIIARAITEPLRNLADGVDQIGKGNLDTRLDIRSNDEIGRLSDVFNQMAIQLKRSHNALRTSESYYRSLFENSLDIITVITDSGMIRYQSPSIRQILNYLPEDVIGRNFFEFIHPDDLSRVQDFFKRAFEQTDVVHSLTYRVRHYEGNWRTLENVVKKLSGDAAISGVIINSRDITVRKQSEQKLKESEERFRALAENSYDVIMRFSRECEYLYVNPIIEAYTGIRPDKFIGKTFAEMGFYGPLVIKWTAAIRKVFDTAAINRLEFQLPGGKWMDWLVCPELGEDGEVLAVISFAREITERKRNENALLESEDRFRQLSEGAWEAIVIHDQGDILVANKRFYDLFGFELADFQDGNKTEKSGDTDPVAAIRAQVSASDPGPCEAVGLRKDGNTFPIEIQSRQMIYYGRPVRLTAIRDISAIKESEKKQLKLVEQFSRSRRMEALGLLARGVAHDLNNILSGVINYPELILKDKTLNSKHRQWIENIRISGQRAAAVVSDLQTVAPGSALVKSPLNLNTILKQIFTSSEYHEIKSRYHGADLRTYLDPGLMNIHGSQEHIAKTAMNLIAYSMETVAKGGVVIVKTRNRYLDKAFLGYDAVNIGEYVMLTVADDGPGMPISDMERIFEPFYTRKIMGRSGTGLEMTIVWNTVHDHNGYIHITPGERGNIVDLYFPITREEVEREPYYEMLTDFRGNGEHILIVDDEEAQRDIASQILKGLGYEVDSVADGQAAVDYFHDHSADIIILDMVMDPGINGLETYRKILEIHPGQKAIIVSGHTESDEVTDAFKNGVGRYVKKPYSAESIARAVREVLDR